METTNPRIDFRTNAQKIADERLRNRILAGIDLLNAHDPTWVDRFDPAMFDLADGSCCVLGQVFANAEVTGEQYDAYERSMSRSQGSARVNGYTRGLAILDGDLLCGEAAITEYGFFVAADDDGNCGDWDEAQDAWLIALGMDGGQQ